MNGVQMMGINPFVVGLMLISSTYCLTQSTAAKGRLLCSDKPAAGVSVVLYEGFLGKNRLMNKTTTDDDGNFFISGSKFRVWNIDYVVYIYHECEFSGEPNCYRRVELKVPKEYISTIDVPRKPYDISSFELSTRHETEIVDCRGL